MADAVEEPVDLAVAQRRTMLIGLELRRQREIPELPPHRREQLFHRCTCPGTRVADVEALALEVGECLGAGFLASNHCERLGMHREHRAQVTKGAILRERS